MRTGKISFLLLFFFISLFACSNKHHDSLSFRVLTLKGPSAISMIRWIDEIRRMPDGTIDMEIMNEPSQVRNQILKHKADLAVVPMNMASILYNRQTDYQLLAVPVWGTLYLFGSKNQITCWNDLKGKRVFVMARGMTPDILFRYLLTRQGLQPGKDVALDYRFPTHIDLANAAIAGKAPLAILSEPLVSLAVSRNPQLVPLIDLNQAWVNQNSTHQPMPQTALLVRSQFAQEHAVILKKWILALKQSAHWVNKHPEEAAALIVQYGILPDTALARQAIPRCHISFQKASEVSESIYHYLRILFEYDPRSIGGKIPDDHFIFAK
ncbi:MAG: ABC transporter substrate-binding protein [Bacteroidales bacterium]|nr:ABC transporter substrate-binding protein [Bacteroidales bacterium]